LFVRHNFYRFEASFPKWTSSFEFNIKISCKAILNIIYIFWTSGSLDEARRVGIDTYRGDIYNVIDRLKNASLPYKGTILKIDGHKPLFDPAEAQKLVREHMAGGYDYSYNGHYDGCLIFDDDTSVLPPYNVLDKILKAYVEEDRGSDEMVKMGFERSTVVKVLKMVDKSEYKRRQSPPGIKITPKAFGRDRRMPITNKYGVI